MKAVMIIGRAQNQIAEMKRFFSKEFSVHTCLDTIEDVAGEIKEHKPELILVSMGNGARERYNMIFWTLFSDFKKIPVITLGTSVDKSNFQAFYYDGQFEHMNTPYDNKELLFLCKKKLGLIAPDAEMPKAGTVVGSGTNTNASSSGASSTPEDYTGEKKKILAVDDDAIILRQIKGILDAKYDVSLAVSGTKALTTIAKKHPDLILLDYEMPVCDGRQTLNMIRSDEDIKDIPVVFLTGVSDAVHIKAVLELKPSGYLLKPVNSDMLLSTIEKVLSKKK